jgi:NitT/TauT family transport system substrate-binding protein
VLSLLALTSGCVSDSDAGAAVAANGKTAPAKTLRLGFFANITHAPALVGVRKGLLARELGQTTLKTQVFNAGPAAIEALNAGAIDAAYIGPGPAINAFVKSNGEALRIVSGVMSGGAQLVVKPGITKATQLKGKNLASPQLGGTQDVALRAWLTKNGLKNTPRGGGDVTITPTENAQTLTLFQQGKLDGAWLPEPWASRLVLDAGAEVLVDEKSLWPEGKFVTTHVIVATRFLAQHPQTVEALIRANLESIDWIRANKAAAGAVVNDEIAEATGKPLSDPVVARAFANISPTHDPLAVTLPTLLEHGVAAGLTKKASLKGVYDLRLLNKALQQRKLPAVSAAGLGEE